MSLMSFAISFRSSSRCSMRSTRLRSRSPTSGLVVTDGPLLWPMPGVSLSAVTSGFSYLNECQGVDGSKALVGEVGQAIDLVRVNDVLAHPYGARRCCEGTDGGQHVVTAGRRRRHVERVFDLR